MEAHPTISTEKKGASHSLVGYNVIQTARDADGVLLWLDWTVILACRRVLSSCRDPKPLHVLGVVDRTASAAPVAPIGSKAP